MNASPPTDATIDQAVRHYAQTRPDDVAVLDPNEQLTWAQLNLAADQVATYLHHQGIRNGSRIGWLGPNTVHYAPSLLGSWRVGAALVGMNWRMPQAELEAASQVVGLDHLIADQRFAAAAQQIHPDATSIAGPGGTPWSAIEPVRESRTPQIQEAEAMIYFTSGSTGTPKAVPLTRAAVEATMVHAEVHHFSPGDRALIVPPTFHVAGATWTLYSLKGGVTLVYTDNAAPAALVDTMRNQEVTHAILVPTLIQALVAELRHAPRPLPHLSHIGYGASPIAPELLAEAIEVLGCEFSQVYGMTETGGGVSFLANADHQLEGPGRERLASAGRPGVGVELEIREPGTGGILQHGQVGELWLRTPCLTQGYIGTDDPTGGVLIDGWLNTRDVGYRDAAGFLYLVGRADDMIQTGAENVHPRAVEEVLLNHPAVTDCAVYGVPHPRWGEQVCAAIISTAHPATAAELSAHCAERLAGYQIPKQFLFVDELPRTATGKVQRKELIARTPNLH
ncbi:class I adenylate-forming enzyme family protein [Nocardioides sp. Bht2]|uniref:class I adenylate-forming enzyme family protein n=1 Tax=Nocardioides sp. Bht2 TaxID=3392297 RepID=UPI0039B37243